MGIPLPFVMAYNCVPCTTIPYLRRVDTGPLSVVIPPTESKSLYLSRGLLLIYYRSLPLQQVRLPMSVVIPPTETYPYNKPEYLGPDFRTVSSSIYN